MCGHHRASLSHGHPIGSLELVRAHYRALGQPITVRYRGPRRKNRAGRVSYAGQLTCLKADATHFSVYPRRPL